MRAIIAGLALIALLLVVIRIELELILNKQHGGSRVGGAILLWVLFAAGLVVAGVFLYEWYHVL